tara:strand:+ start:617 stop:1804 length:1188 start_codon:yes stop_codon:yes gene_type:complete
MLSFSFLLNFGISKSIIIACGKFQNSKSEIAFEGLKYSFLVIILLIFFHLVNLHFNIINFKNFSSNVLLIGIILSIIYLVLEGILQSYKKFKAISLFNFLFYSLALSMPSIILIYFENLSLNNLISISISIKFVVVLSICLIMLKDKLVLKSKSKILSNIIKKNSLWLTLNSFLMQLYEMLDKYLIKIFFGNSALAIYSIPQQLTGKLSVLSRGFSAFLMPFLSAGSKKEDFNKTLDIFFCLVPIIIFSLFPLYSLILSTWLGENYSEQILSLTKIFSLIAILSSTSHILITNFEANQISKINFKIEIFLLPIFLIVLIYLFLYHDSLVNISLVVLSKELILNILRLFYLKKKIKNYKKYFINLILFNLILFFSFQEISVYIILLFILIIFNLKK